MLYSTNNHNYITVRYVVVICSRIARYPIAAEDRNVAAGCLWPKGDGSGGRSPHGAVSEKGEVLLRGVGTLRHLFYPQ